MTAAHYPGIDDAEVAGKRVLLRLDLNVPMKDGKVTDMTRIERMLPTVRALMERGARTIVLSHLGRPKGKPVPEMSLRPVSDALAQALGAPVRFATDCVGRTARDVVDALGDGDVTLLENVRFHAGEEMNDPAFARALAALGDVYVNDAFSAAHRAHASTEGLAHLLPAYAGPAMLAEIEALSRALERPERPVAAMIGGAKISTKIAVLQNLIPKVDALIVGGAMANTFLLARGLDVGASLAEPDLAEEARRIMEVAARGGCDIVLPQDAMVAKEFKEGADRETCAVEAVPDGMMILDVGPRSVADLEARLSRLKTLLWNGPLGAFEIPPFGAGTLAVARHAAALTKQGRLVTVAGGGDTVAALNAAGVTGDFTYVSTAGGAFLEWLEGRDLPGVAALAR